VELLWGQVAGTPSAPDISSAVCTVSRGSGSLRPGVDRPAHIVGNRRSHLYGVTVSVKAWGTTCLVLPLPNVALRVKW